MFCACIRARKPFHEIIRIVDHQPATNQLHSSGQCGRVLCFVYPSRTQILFGTHPETTGSRLSSNNFTKTEHNTAVASFKIQLDIIASEPTIGSLVVFQFHSQKQATRRIWGIKYSSQKWRFRVGSPDLLKISNQILVGYLSSLSSWVVIIGLGVRSSQPSWDDDLELRIWGPDLYEVNEHFVKPLTSAAGGMSYALMKHPQGLLCEVFISHAWAEGREPLSLRRSR